MSIKSILVTQPSPETEKNPYSDPAKKHKLKIDFREFIQIEGVDVKEFRKDRINIPDYSAIILTSRNAVDHFFRVCKEIRYTVPDTLKYFCQCVVLCVVLFVVSCVVLFVVLFVF